MFFSSTALSLKGHGGIRLFLSKKPRLIAGHRLILGDFFPMSIQKTSEIAIFSTRTCRIHDKKIFNFYLNYKGIATRHIIGMMGAYGVCVLRKAFASSLSRSGYCVGSGHHAPPLDGEVWIVRWIRKQHRK